MFTFDNIEYSYFFVNYELFISESGFIILVGLTTFVEKWLQGQG